MLRVPSKHDRGRSTVMAESYEEKNNVGVWWLTAFLTPRNSRNTKCDTFPINPLGDHFPLVLRVHKKTVISIMLHKSRS